MKIGILSDTHRNLTLASRALGEMGPIDLLVHLGDFYQDVLALSALTPSWIAAVAGNGDFEYTVPDERTIEVSGKRLFLTHGHHYEVNRGVDRLLAKARREKADVVLFGHTHKALVRRIDGILFVNPGFMFLGHPKGSYALLSVDEAGVHASIRELSV